MGKFGFWQFTGHQELWYKDLKVSIDDLKFFYRDMDEFWTPFNDNYNLFGIYANNWWIVLKLENGLDMYWSDWVIPTWGLWFDTCEWSIEVFARSYGFTITDVTDTSIGIMDEYMFFAICGLWLGSCLLYNYYYIQPTYICFRDCLFDEVLELNWSLVPLRPFNSVEVLSAIPRSEIIEIVAYTFQEILVI